MKHLFMMLLVITMPVAIHAQAYSQSKTSGTLLENLTWIEAEKMLTPETVIVIPIGAASKEHGPHLKLNADRMQAEYFKRELLQKTNVVIAPTIAYNFYPAFREYPGSTSLSLETSRDTVVEVCRSLAKYGPRRFYIINIGISTNSALKPASELLAKEGIVLRYLDLTTKGPIEKAVSKQEGGSHADEVETSIMLYIAPKSVDMKKAVKDYNPRKGRGPLTRNPNAPEGIYSPSGIWGDATLATREKGQKIVQELVSRMLKEIEELRRAAVPENSVQR